MNQKHGVPPSSLNHALDSSVLFNNPLHGYQQLTTAADPRAILDREQEMQRQFEKTVTIVLWFQSGLEPLRLQYMIPTFPTFQLSQFTSLVTDLGLGTATYLDTYNPQSGKWEQHNTQTVRIVERQQRLLYRIRKSLLVALADSECVGLADELDTQRPPIRGTKRPLSAIVAPTPSNHYPHLQPMPKPKLPDTEKPMNSLTPPPPDVQLHYPPVYQQLPVIQKQHPPLKRWPNDYTVFEIARGFHAMDAISSSQPSEPEDAPSTQKVAFERIFRSRYVKSTVCRHRGFWRKAPKELREEFEGYGDDDERGIWGEFVRRVEGKPPGKGVMKKVEEPIMDSLQPS